MKYTAWIERTIRVIKWSRERLGGGIQHVCEERGEGNAWFAWRNLKERDLGVGNRIILKRILKKQAVRAYTRLIWLRIGPSGWL